MSREPAGRPVGFVFGTEPGERHRLTGEMASALVGMADRATRAAHEALAAARAAERRAAAKRKG